MDPLRHHVRRLIGEPEPAEDITDLAIILGLINLDFHPLNRIARVQIEAPRRGQSTADYGEHYDATKHDQPLWRAAMRLKFPRYPPRVPSRRISPPTNDESSVVPDLSAAPAQTFRQT